MAWPSEEMMLNVLPQEEGMAKVLPQQDDMAELARCVDYLPKRMVAKLKNKKLFKDDVGMFKSYVMMYTGEWLQICGQSGDVEGLQQNVFNEALNVAIVAALMFTVVLPLADSSKGHWLGEDFLGSGSDGEEGAIGQLMGKEWLECAIPYLHDIEYTCYILAGMAYFLCMLACIFILLAVNELASDRLVSEFVQRMRKLMSAPYWLFMAAGMPLIGGIVVRAAFGFKTWGWMAGCFCCVALMAFLNAFYLQPKIIKAVVETIIEDAKFEPLELAQGEAQADVANYLDKMGQKASLADCLYSLQAQTDKGLAFPLAERTVLYVKAEYVKQMAAIIGVSLKELVTLMNI